jgi:ribosomal protein L7/L12
MDDLRARVRDLEQLVEHLYAVLDVSRPAPNSDVSTAVRELASRGNLIKAIKVYREETGCDLVTAKNVVESL